MPLDFNLDVAYPTTSVTQCQQGQNNMKMEDLGDEPRVRKHMLMSETLWELFKEEAIENHGGNHSLLLRKILAKRYKDKLKELEN